MKKNSSVKAAVKQAVLYSMFLATWMGIVVLWVYQF